MEVNDTQQAQPVVSTATHFSVLMSVYEKDNAEYLDDALQSIWYQQTRKPSQIVLVCDGPLAIEIEQVLDRWQQDLGGVLDVLRLPSNAGLGNALNYGLHHCRYDLVARMDADDIALPSRFAEQVEYMVSHLDVSVLGAWVEEIHPVTRLPMSIKKVPETFSDIQKTCKYRNPLNHPSVIYRKHQVLSVGGYPSFRKSQDYALWSLMLANQHQLANISRVLLKMRTGIGLVERRGWAYLKAEIQLLRYQRRIGFISSAQYVFNVLIRSAFRLPPKKIRLLLYKALRVLDYRKM